MRFRGLRIFEITFDTSFSDSSRVDGLLMTSTLGKEARKYLSENTMKVFCNYSPNQVKIIHGDLVNWC